MRQEAKRLKGSSTSLCVTMRELHRCQSQLIRGMNSTSRRLLASARRWCSGYRCGPPEISQLHLSQRRRHPSSHSLGITTCTCVAAFTANNTAQMQLVLYCPLIVLQTCNQCTLDMVAGVPLAFHVLRSFRRTRAVFSRVHASPCAKYRFLEPRKAFSTLDSRTLPDRLQNKTRVSNPLWR